MKYYFTIIENFFTFKIEYNINVTENTIEETININLPIEGAIACGDFLGIEGGDNVVLYKNKVLK